MKNPNFYKNKLIFTSVIFGIISVLLFAVILLPVYLLNSSKTEYIKMQDNFLSQRSEIKKLESENQELENLIAIGTRTERITLVEFYARAQRVFQDAGLNVIEIQQDDDKYFLKITLEGDYYAFVTALAGLRLLKNPVKIISLTISKNTQDPVNLVNADLVLATMRP